MTTRSANFGMAELEKERTIGGMGQTRERDVPRIDLSDFDARKAEDRRSALARFDGDRLLPARQSRHPAGADR